MNSIATSFVRTATLFVLRQFGLLSPAGTPADVVDRVQKESAAAMGTPTLKERLLSQGALPGGMAPAAFASYIAAETTKWAKVVKASGATVD